jgi:hypothetical protein
VRRALAALALALAACAQSKELATEVAAAGAMAEGAIAAATPPLVEAPPLDPFEGITGELALGFADEAMLLTSEPPDRFSAPALELACLPNKDALSSPASADARLESLATEQAAKLGRLRFVRFESDVSAVPMRTVPRLCRVVHEAQALYAPLFRLREPPALWLVERLREGDLSVALATLIARAGEEGRAPSGPPRVLVVRGEAIAAALPLAGPHHVTAPRSEVE